jgi:transcriptional regulator with XRE-family HTH domain
MRSARSRAALSQNDLAKLLSIPRSQIARWEADDVDPGFSTVRRVLQACGFDLTMGLVPFDRDSPREARLVELHNLTPKERLDAALVRGGAIQMGYDFDPYSHIADLDAQGVDYILIGSLARVLQGADEIPGSVDFTFPKGSFHPVDQALTSFASRAPGSAFITGAACNYWSKAERVNLGRGLRPSIAAPGDLVRMLEALGRPKDDDRLRAMRRLVEVIHEPGSANAGVSASFVTDSPDSRTDLVPATHRSSPRAASRDRRAGE